MVNHDVNFHVTFRADYSTLAVLAAGRADSGNYTCAPHNLAPASVIVHVLAEGSNSAAAIHEAGDNQSAAAAVPASSGNRSFQPSIGISTAVVVASAIANTR